MNKMCSCLNALHFWRAQKCEVRFFVGILCFSILTPLHAAVLGENDRGLRFKEAFRNMTQAEVDGPLNAGGALFCWHQVFQDYWKQASAFLVRNSKGELRIITNKHVVTDSSRGFEHLHRESTATTCYFAPLSILFTAYQHKKPCLWLFRRENTRMYLAYPGQLLGCLKRKGLVYELQVEKNFPRTSVGGDRFADVAILKFKKKTPVTVPLKLVALPVGSFAVEKRGEGNFFATQRRFVSGLFVQVARTCEQTQLFYLSQRPAPADIRGRGRYSDYGLPQHFWFFGRSRGVPTHPKPSGRFYALHPSGRGF